MPTDVREREGMSLLTADDPQRKEPALCAVPCGYRRNWDDGPLPILPNTCLTLTALACTYRIVVLVFL